MYNLSISHILQFKPIILNNPQFHEHLKCFMSTFLSCKGFENEELHKQFKQHAALISNACRRRFCIGQRPGHPLTIYIAFQELVEWWRMLGWFPLSFKILIKPEWPPGQLYWIICPCCHNCQSMERTQTIEHVLCELAKVVKLTSLARSFGLVAERYQST